MYHRRLGTSLLPSHDSNPVLSNLLRNLSGHLRNILQLNGGQNSLSLAIPEGVVAHEEPQGRPDSLTSDLFLVQVTVRLVDVNFFILGFRSLFTFHFLLDLTQDPGF